MEKQKLVLVGNGMAGIRTIEALLELAPDRYEITVFGAEPHGNYNRILLSPVLAGEMGIAEIMLNDLDWYRERGITLHAGKPVTHIDRARRQVVAADGTCAPYDRLLLATGSTPFMLPIPGNKLPGVIGYRDIQDTDAMIEAARVHRHAVVIGGEDGRVAAVRFKDGLQIPAGLVVMAAGIRPNVALAEACGLHCERGVVVSDTMQTFDPRIYAVGECVSHRGIAYGLVAPLFEQARVAANHLAGHGIGRYTGSVTSTRLKVTGIDLFSAGDFMGGQESEEIVLNDPQGGVYKKLVIRDGKLVGGVMYGDTTDGPWYFQLLKDGRDIRDIRDVLIFGRALAGDAGHAGPH